LMTRTTPPPPPDVVDNDDKHYTVQLQILLLMKAIKKTIPDRGMYDPPAKDQREP
jgi:hypothetical protein